MSAEHIYYQSDDILITSRRAAFGSKTYALNNITSVSQNRQPPDLTLPGLALGFGAILAASSLGFLALAANENLPGHWACFGISVGVSALAFYFGFRWWGDAKPSWRIQLGSASGETEAFSTQNLKQAIAITEALNDALAG